MALDAQVYIERESGSVSLDGHSFLFVQTDICSYNLTCMSILMSMGSFFSQIIDQPMIFWPYEEPYFLYSLLRYKYLFSVSGKCFGNRDQIHEAHKIVVQSVSVLLCRNSFCHTDSSLPLTVLLDLIGKEYSEDVFAVERAGVLYNFCWLSLKVYHSKKSRYLCLCIFYFLFFLG